MDYSIKKDYLCACETIFDGLVEQPVDLDFSLPDYCPDRTNCFTSPSNASRLRGSAFTSST